MHRLHEILDNLHARLAEARDQGWLGEAEGLQTTIAGAEQKLAAMQRSATSPTRRIELRSHRWE
jgi:hypothetical protein